MQCPPEIAELVSEILRLGILRIRNLSRQDADFCFLEADHLHNLPSLLLDYSQERLDYYWYAERVSCLKWLPAEQTQGFEPLWQSLGNYVTLPKKQAVAG